MTWYSDNFATSAQDLAEQKEQQARNQARRIWVKTGSHVDVIFIDQRAFNFYEHKLWLGGEASVFTCLGVAQGCPLCIDGNEPKKTTVFSVIDTTQWKDKKGNVHENEKKILALGADQTELLRQKKENWGGLEGRVVRIRRVGDKSPGSGNDFELMLRDNQPIRPDMKRYKNPQAFDYLAIYKPLSREKLLIQYAKAKKAGESAEAVPLGEAYTSSGALGEGSSSGSWDNAPPAGEIDESAADIPF